MFSDVASAEDQYAEMMRLKAHAEATGWSMFFADTDIPDSPEGIARLWVRRFAYDPTADLKQIKCPTLALLGGTDRVSIGVEHTGHRSGAALLRAVSMDAISSAVNDRMGAMRWTRFCRIAYKVVCADRRVAESCPSQ